MLLAAVFLILALARPRFGSIIGPPLPPGHDVALLIDVSRSMGAEDAVPNRLAVAVDAAESLLGALAPDPANRAAIVVFAGRGVIRYPLTENLEAVVDVLHRLQPGSVRPAAPTWPRDSMSRSRRLDRSSMPRDVRSWSFPTGKISRITGDHGSTAWFGPESSFMSC